MTREGLELTAVGLGALFVWFLTFDGIAALFGERPGRLPAEIGAFATILALGVLGLLVWMFVVYSRDATRREKARRQRERQEHRERVRSRYERTDPDA